MIHEPFHFLCESNSYVPSGMWLALTCHVGKFSDFITCWSFGLFLCSQLAIIIFKIRFRVFWNVNFRCLWILLRFRVLFLDDCEYYPKEYICHRDPRYLSSMQIRSLLSLMPFWVLLTSFWLASTNYHFLKILFKVHVKFKCRVQLWEWPIVQGGFCEWPTVQVCIRWLSFMSFHKCPLWVLSGVRTKWKLTYNHGLALLIPWRNTQSLYGNWLARSRAYLLFHWRHIDGHHMFIRPSGG